MLSNLNFKIFIKNNYFQMLEKDNLYVYLKNSENENIRQIIRNLKFEIIDFYKQWNQLRYDINDENTRNQLLEILNLKLDTDLCEIRNNFMYLHKEELVFCWLPYESTFPKAFRLINYWIWSLRHDEILLPYGMRYLLEKSWNSIFFNDLKQTANETFNKHKVTVNHSNAICLFDIEIPLSKKDEKLSTVYCGLEKLKITSTNMIYPETYEELYKVKDMIAKWEYIDFYINTLHCSHEQKIRDMEPYTWTDYESFCPEIKARKEHLSRAHRTNPPKDKIELKQRVDFLLERIFEITESSGYELEKNYNPIE